MALTLLDNDESLAADPQSIWMQTDIDAIIAGFNGTYVVSGCLVTAQGTPDMTVHVAAGTGAVGGTIATVNAGDVTVGAADGSNPRVDLIRADNTGTLGITAGTAAANPKAPALPANNVLLAMVLVPAGVTSILSTYITDKRVIVPHQGTSGTLAKFSGGTTFINSIISESGSVATVTGTLGAQGFVYNEALGAELVTNGDFATGTADGWTTTDWTVNAGVDVQHNTGNVTALFPTTPLSVIAGTLYKVTYTVSSRTAGNVQASLGGTTGAIRATNATFSDYLLATTTANLAITPITSTFDGHIDDVSVKAVSNPTVQGNGTPIVFSSNVTSGPAFAVMRGTGQLFYIDQATGNIRIGDESAGNVSIIVNQRTGSGAGRTLTISAGAALTGNAAGGSGSYGGGHGSGTSAGGAATLQGGTGGTGGGTGGGANVNGAPGVGGATPGNGGAVNITGGIDGGPGKSGGGVTIRSGSGASDSGSDGHIILGVDALSGFNDGNIDFRLKSTPGTGTTGAVRFMSGSSTVLWSMDQAGVLTASTGKTLVVGSNTLIGAVADKLNAAHLAIASQAIGDLLYADSTTTFARLGVGAAGTVLGGGTTPAWITLANTVLAIPGTNLTASGPQTSAFQAGGTITAGDLVILNSSSQWVQTDANAAATYAGLLAISLQSKTVGQAMLVALPGSIVQNTAWAWTPGNTLYISETAGAITATQPTTTDAAIRVIGYAVDADDVYFMPAGTWITHT